MKPITYKPWLFASTALFVVWMWGGTLADLFHRARPLPEPGSMRTPAPPAEPVEVVEERPGETEPPAPDARNPVSRPGDVASLQRETTIVVHNARLDERRLEAMVRRGDVQVAVVRVVDGKVSGAFLSDESGTLRPADAKGLDAWRGLRFPASECFWLAWRSEDDAVTTRARRACSLAGEDFLSYRVNVILSPSLSAALFNRCVEALEAEGLEFERVAETHVRIEQSGDATAFQFVEFKEKP